MQAISLFDGRPFFEKALAYGVQHGLLTPQKLDAMCQEAPKGMVQIARYFGTEFLRPELERAKDRMVNLISLHLEATTHGDLQQAAELLRDNSLLSRSKAGSDMLKALIAMPQNSHFGMHEPGGFQDTHIPVLAKWALQSLPQYQAELAKRNAVQQLVDAALWMAEQLGMDEEALQESNADAEAVMRTALIALAAKRTEMPDWVDFAKLIASASKKIATAPASAVIPLPKGVPPELLPTVETMRQSVWDDLPKIADSTVPARKLFDQTPAFMGRYFWLEDGLAEVDHYHRQVSATWEKATGGRHDDSTLLTLFLTLAAGATQKTLLTEKTAATLVRKIRKSGLHPELTTAFITQHAPDAQRNDYLQLWQHFVDEAQATLESDRDYALNDALSLLRRECNVKAS
ncbi:MAG TPA: hypothetical protein PKX82_05585 [Rhodoferax sp.]|nr:hypothetical protein [Rhodoferax sp.]